MKIEIIERRENKLLNRSEVRYRIVHPGDPTPSRQKAKEQLSANLQVPAEIVIIDDQHSKFGRTYTEGYAKIYTSKEDAMKLEPDFILFRNGLKSKGEDKNAEKGNVQS
ncbi:MAG: 30S ribosomal protein S24e [Thermoplasmatales archaeon]